MSTFFDTTYPPEDSFSSDEETNITFIRSLAGDPKKLVYDKYGSTGFSDRVISSGTSYFMENKGWPLRVTSSSGPHESLDNPYVSDYRLLTFQTDDVLSDSTFELFYETFKFSDVEILQAYDTAVVILKDRSLPVNKITGNLALTQAAIILLETELEGNIPNYIKVVEGRTEYDSTAQASAIQKRLDNLRHQLDVMMLQARHHASLMLDIIRLE